MKKKHALISYVTFPPKPSGDMRFNNAAKNRIMVKALVDIGYSVDVIDWDRRGFRSDKEYDLFIGHGGANWEYLSRNIVPQAIKIYFSTGIYWKKFNRCEEERFESLKQRRGIKLPYDRRIKYSEEFANHDADGIICFGSRNYSYSHFIVSININNGCYADDYFNEKTKDYNFGRKRFLFFSGSGSIHKGLDRVIEAFTRVDAELYCACPVEPYFIEAYKSELEKYSNIHLFGWIELRSPQFYKLMDSCNCVVLPSCAEGQPGSVIECMNQGLIPIVSKETNINAENYGVILPSNSVEEIAKTVSQVSSKPVEWHREHSIKTREAALQNYSEEAFYINFRAAVKKIIEQAPSVRSKRREEAEKVFDNPRTYLAVNKNHLGMLLAGAAYLKAQSRFYDAEELFQRAIALEPECATAIVELAECHVYKGQTQSAIALTRKALKLCPGDKQCLSFLSSLEQGKQYIDKNNTVFPPAFRNKTDTSQSASTSVIEKILWVRTDSIGDNVLASSMLSYISEKYKGAKITVLCQEHIAPLYESCPFVDGAIVFNRQRALSGVQYRKQIIEQLLSLKADLVLNSVYSRESLTDIFALNCGARKSVALNGNLCNSSEEILQKFNRLYTTLLTSEGEHKTELQRHKDFLKGLDINVRALQPVVWIKPEDEKLAAKFFSENSLNPDRTVALFAGAQYDCRLYENYGRGLSEFCREKQFNVIALGGAADYEINERNLDDIGVRVVNLSGKTSILQSAAIIKCCRLAVGAETALAHISCAVGTPNIILLGGGHFGRFMPYSPLSSIVCLPFDCFGCNWNKCKFGRQRCVKDVAPEIIAEAIRQTYEESSEKSRVFVQDNKLYRTNTGHINAKTFERFLNIEDVQIIEYSDSFNSHGESKSTIVTSIAPKDIKRQAKAVESWMKIGFDVVSINCADEIDMLKQDFPKVNFVVAKRDGRELFGKAVIYLDDFLEYFRQNDCQLCGIVNSDVFLLGDEGVVSFIKKESADSLVYGSRVNVDSLNMLDGEIFDEGFDFFFFPKTLLSHFPESNFCVGMPWWDYWMVLIPILEGLSVKKLVSPFAYHIKHSFKWNRAQGELLINECFKRLQPELEKNFNENPDTNQYAFLARMLKDYHNRDIKKNKRTANNLISPDAFYRCIFDFLKIKSCIFSYTNNKPETLQTESTEQQKDIFIHENSPKVLNTDSPNADYDISIVLCTKNRAELLDRMLTSLKQAAKCVAYEVIVVEGGSADHTLDILRKHKITKIYNETEWLGPGQHSWPQLYNFGFSKAAGKWAMYASDDIIFSEGAISLAFRTLSSQSDRVAGGIFFYKNIYCLEGEQQWANYGIDFTYGRQLLMNYGLVKLDCFSEVGGLDQSYSFYCADTDFCFKLYEKDYQLIPLPECFIAHNNIPDNQKIRSFRTADADTKLLLKRWRRFVSTKTPNPKRLIWHEEMFNKPHLQQVLEKSDLRIQGIIFSRDRAMQLQAVIESFFLHCADADKIDLFVLYKATNQQQRCQYDQLKIKYDAVLFIEESNFKEQVLSILKNSEYVLFLVDDNLFVKDFRITNVHKVLQQNIDSIGFSLRLGRNTNYCYARDKKQSLPEFERMNSEILKYRWIKAELDFGYPLELSSSMYRAADILPLLDKLEFTNPNVLEDKMAANTAIYAKARPCLLCFDSSVTFCNPVNKVQSVWNNRAGTEHRYSHDSLAKLFEGGERIDVERYSGFVPSACHQEVTLHFKQAENKIKQGADDSSLIFKPKFSVIMCNYNNAEYIADAIESVLNQTFKDWELIIVEDCSTDNSIQVIEKYFGDSRIKLVQNKKNCGYTASLKTGIANVQSEYFGILDSDDSLLPDALETMYAYHTKYEKCGLIYSQFAYCDKSLNRKRVGFCNQIPPGKTTLDVNAVSHFKTFKLRDYLKTSGYDENILYAEDIDIIYKMEEVTNLKFADKCLYLYRELPDSLCHSKSKINVAIMSRVKARINAISRRCIALAESGQGSYKEMFSHAIRQARAGYRDVEQYFSILQKLYENGQFENLGLPADMENWTIECRILWLAVNVNIDFEKLFEVLKKHPVLPKKPLISVEMITYNAEKFIARAIESVLAQTYRNFELLIVDDGSTDNTSEIISSYSDDRIRYIRKLHENAASARNRVIGEAKSEYLLCVDSDDFVYPGYIEEIVDFAEKYPLIDYFYPAKLTLINESGNPIGQDWNYMDFPDSSILPSFLFRNCYGPIPNPGSLKRKSLFDKAGLYDELDTVEDFAFLCKNVMKIRFKRIDNHSIYCYRRHRQNISRKFMARNRIMADVLNDMVSIYPPHVLYPELANIDDPLKQQRYYEYLVETFSRHVNGPMVKFGLFFQSYADIYRQKLLKIIGHEQLAPK